jgi:hypothetical protein
MTRSCVTCLAQATGAHRSMVMWRDPETHESLHVTARKPTRAADTGDDL